MTRTKRIRLKITLLSESFTKDEFSIESQMLHQCSVEGWIGLKKGDGVTGVCVAGRRVHRGRWNRCG